MCFKGCAEDLDHSFGIRYDGWADFKVVVEAGICHAWRCSRSPRLIKFAIGKGSMPKGS